MSQGWTDIPEWRVTMTGTSSDATLDTIVLIHGVWLTPRCWEHWIDRYESGWYRVIAPPWRGTEGDVEELRPDPTPRKNTVVAQTVRNYDAIVSKLDAPSSLATPSAGCSHRGSVHHLGFHMRHSKASVHPEVLLARTAQPRQPQQGCGAHPQAVSLRIHQHSE